MNCTPKVGQKNNFWGAVQDFSRLSFFISSIKNTKKIGRITIYLSILISILN